MWLQAEKLFDHVSFKEDQKEKGIKGIISGLRVFPDMPPIQKNADTFIATSDGISANSIEAFGNYWTKWSFLAIFRG
tara:strand:- start:17 stop:247 length:231 start_codon:yes stop_codon:yes gene_type:complete